MGLETVNYISDLVITNPVGAVDPKSQGDDHIRNIKKALKATFGSFVGGAVTLTEAQINDAARKSASNTFTGSLQIFQSAEVRIDNVNSFLSLYNGSGTRRGYLQLSGNNIELVAETHNLTLSGAAISLNGVASSDFARLSQNNTFTGPTQRIYGANGSVRLKDTGGTANRRVADFVIVGNQLQSRWLNDAEDASVAWLTVGLETDGSGAISLSGDSITLNGVNITDFARLSQNNTFTGATQTISAAAAPKLVVTDTTSSVSTLLNSDDTFGLVGTSTAHTFHLVTGNSSRMSIDSSGNIDFKTGTVTVGGALQTTNTVTPAALSASQNDYAPSGHANANLFRLDPNGNTPAVITGLAGGVAGRRITIMRIAGTSGTIQFTNESASSTAANRFMASGASWALSTTLVALDFIYDGTLSRWVPIGGIS